MSIRTPIRRTLSSERWTLRAVGDDAEVPPVIRGVTFPASVPGCVHTDLLAAGVIGHPNDGYNERELSWIGWTDWAYRCTFVAGEELRAHERVELVCDGLDTIATIELNGQIVGSAANMHHPHRFDVRPALRQGENELTVCFRGPLAQAREQEAIHGPRPFNGDWGPYNYIRKMACNFGWDWGPMVPTAGIWRDIGLHAWSGVRLDSVRPLVRRAEGDEWVVDVHVNLEWAAPPAAAPRDVRVGATVPEGGARGAVRVTAEDAAVHVPLRVCGPKLWWPRGCGEPVLYDVQVELETGGASEPLDRWAARIGFRTVCLNTGPDEVGSAFTIEINGRPVFCRGANWIPEGLFPAALTPKDYRTRLQQAADANMNMLRVWGGGIYEHPAFYETCDELGLLVWQDFMLACSTYPEEEPFRSQFEAEARYNITRLSPHPSVVLYCGGNECVWAYERWGFKERMQPGQSWGAGYYFDLFPRLMAELDPTRLYWPNSPYSGSCDIDVLSCEHGNHHLWDAAVEGYRDFVPRFVSEFGHQSPPNWATLREALRPEDLTIGSPALQHRQRAMGGDAVRYEVPLGQWFPRPQTFDDWHFLAQLLQARAICLGIEWLRSQQPRCMGALYWQLNDCWAGHSWSAIDWRGRRKPLWYASRRAYAPRLLTIQPRDGRPWLFAVNESDAPWEAAVRLRRMRFDGTVLAEQSLALSSGPHASVGVCDLTDRLGPPTDGRCELLVADAVQRRALWFFDRDRNLAYPPPAFEADATREGGGLRLELRAESLLRDVVLAVDRLDPAAQVDDNLVTLLPGESCVLKIASAQELSKEALTLPPVLNCANRFGASKGPAAHRP